MIALLLFAQTLRLAVPYLLAAAGGALSERAGVVALALEAFLLGGAFACTLAAQHAGPWAGLLAGALAGALLAALLAWFTLRLHADQVVTGLALNLLALGGTRFLLQAIWDSSSNSPRVEGFDTGALGLWHPLVPVALLAAPVLHVILGHTRYGLRVRAVGEHPAAAAAAGVPVRSVRAVAVITSGVLAGSGGAWLALDQHKFTEAMSAGRGFLALAAILFGRWEPLRVFAACLLFAAAEVLQLRLQSTGLLPAPLAIALPYLLALAALAKGRTRAHAPAALGKPFA